MTQLQKIQKDIDKIFHDRKMMKSKINNIILNSENYTISDYIKIKEKEKKLREYKYILESRLKKFKRLNEINKSNI